MGTIARNMTTGKYVTSDSTAGPLYVDIGIHRTNMLPGDLVLDITTATKKSVNKVSVNPTTKIPGNFYIEKNGSTKMIYIKKVLYNNPVTVVWWSDGTVTRNRCPENVTYNPDTGLLFCIAKRLLGNNDVAEIFNAWSLPENEEANNAYVTLKDVRKTLREEGKLD